MTFPRVLAKLRRAYRNKTGAHLTPADLRDLETLGFLHFLAKAEGDAWAADERAEGGW